VINKGNRMGDVDSAVISVVVETDQWIRLLIPRGSQSGAPKRSTGNGYEMWDVLCPEGCQMVDV
jgi:hypothetical protein